tara:strand:+ start:2146 stop:2475 length:330 start_codon:yes stop_codon:yes gene_type:complete
MTGNAKLPAVNALTVIREQEEVISRLTAERDALSKQLSDIRAQAEDATEYVLAQINKELVAERIDAADKIVVSDKLGNDLLARVEQLESDCETLRFKVFHKSLGNKENI